jgi:hypothetical protein
MEVSERESVFLLFKGGRLVVDGGWVVLVHVRWQWVCKCVCLYAWLSVSLSQYVCLLAFLPVTRLCVFDCVCVCVCVRAHVCACVCVCLRACECVLLRLSVCMCVSACLPACLPVYLSVCGRWVTKAIK